MIACDEYLPVPTMSRDVNVRPAMTTGVSIMLMRGLTAADEVDDFDAVAVADDDLGKALTLEDGEVMLHCHAPRIDVELRQQGDDRHRLVELELFAVQGNNQCDSWVCNLRASGCDLVSGLSLTQVKVSS